MAAVTISLAIAAIVDVAHCDSRDPPACSFCGSGSTRPGWLLAAAEPESQAHTCRADAVPDPEPDGVIGPIESLLSLPPVLPPARGAVRLSAG